MYELYEKFKCPKCNGTFDCIETLDIDITKDQVIIKCSGYCGECELYENWIMVYQLKEIKKEKNWIITFSNGYCGCDIEEEFVGTYEEAVEFANDYLPDYAETYSYVHFGWDCEEYDEDEYEEYKADCGYNIKEREEDE